MLTNRAFRTFGAMGDRTGEAEGRRAGHPSNSHSGNFAGFGMPQAFGLLATLAQAALPSRRLTQGAARLVA